MADSLPETIKTKIKNDVGDFLVESVLSSVANAKSPVQGEDWPGLSKKYKKFKIDEGMAGIANMELQGDMLDALKFKSTDSGLDLGFWGAEAWKADGHLKFSGKENNTPQRRFLPDVGEDFTPAIQKEVASIIADAIADSFEFTKDDFSAVNNTAELYDVLDDYFTDMSRAEIRSVVTRTPALVSLLDDLGMLDLL